MTIEAEARIIILVYLLLATVAAGIILVYYLIRYIIQQRDRVDESVEYAKLFKFLYEKERYKNDVTERKNSSPGS